MRSRTTKCVGKQMYLALLIASTLAACVFVVSSVKLIAQSPQFSSSDKRQSAATSASSPAATKSTSTASPSTTPASATQTSAAPAKTQTPQANAPGVVWVNNDTGVYHKQGSRWYGKTKHGKYMLEADAIKAGYKAAK